MASGKVMHLALYVSYIIVNLYPAMCLTFPWMVSDCGLQDFEKESSLGGSVFENYKLKEINAQNVLFCVMECFYHRVCMSVVYNGQLSSCYMYLTHMDSTFSQSPDANAIYLQFKDPNDCPTLGLTCGANAGCLNLRDGDTCHCDDGYSGDGYICSDVDECTLGTDTCDANADCSNTIGFYTCTCRTGWTGDGNTCTDIDECTLGTYTCHINAHCINNEGSYTCACNNMYFGDGQTCQLKEIRGEACTVASDCIRADFICENGVCDCDLGLSFNRTQNLCVTKCDVYGDEFSMQSTPYCVTGNNDASSYDFSFEGCKAQCIAAPFTCRTFELWSDRCWLSTVVKSDVPDSDWDPWTGCMYHQRHCA